MSLHDDNRRPASLTSPADGDILGSDGPRSSRRAFWKAGLLGPFGSASMPSSPTLNRCDGT